MVIEKFYGEYSIFILAWSGLGMKSQNRVLASFYGGTFLLLQPDSLNSLHDASATVLGQPLSDRPTLPQVSAALP